MDAGLHDHHRDELCDGAAGRSSSEANAPALVDESSRCGENIRSRPRIQLSTSRRQHSRPPYSLASRRPSFSRIPSIICYTVASSLTSTWHPTSWKQLRQLRALIVSIGNNQLGALLPKRQTNRATQSSRVAGHQCNVSFVNLMLPQSNCSIPRGSHRSMFGPPTSHSSASQPENITHVVPPVTGPRVAGKHHADQTFI